MRKSIVLIALVVCLVGCSSPTNLDVPTNTPTALPTQTATIPATNTPAPTSTSMPTYTPYPTYTSQPTASPMPSATPIPPTVQPTNTPNPSPTSTPSATALPSPTSAPSGSSISNPDQEAHYKRLKELDVTFRKDGLEAWLRAAGLTWQGLKADARQIEEEVDPATGQILAAGVQVDAVKLVINWPCIVTTDDPSRIVTTATTRRYQPDQRNKSVLYTEVVVNGKVTIWVDAQNWPQLAP